jgi:hypothetical protein
LIADADKIASQLAYFHDLSHLSVRLNTVNKSAISDVDAFVKILERIDECSDFMKKHVSFVDYVIVD